jgi:hypothetical protein
MKRLGIILAAAALLYAGWYGVWRMMMASDVARVAATISYQDKQFKAADRYVTLKAEHVGPAGFPFHFQVRVTRPELSQIFNKETYAVSFPEIILVPVDSDEGRYRVIAPTHFDALYAVDGQPPEQYHASVDAMPLVLLRAQGDSNQCSNFPGSTPCPAVASDAPLITYAVQLPHTILLHMELNGESRDASFTLIPLDVPIFRTIPANIDDPLELFVGVLRQALVFHAKD